MKVLFISPHPDDCEIACGGTILQEIYKGALVSLAVVVGAGDLRMLHSGKTVTFDQRVLEQNRAASVLGIHKIHWLDIGPAAQLDTVPLSKGVCKLDNLFATEKFDKVYIPLSSYAQDHRYTWDMCMAATRPSKVDYMSIFAYEQPTQFHGLQVPLGVSCRHYVTFGKPEQVLKETAILCHKSQSSTREQSLVAVGGVRSLAKLRGLEVSCEYAEMFMPIRVVV